MNFYTFFTKKIKKKKRFFILKPWALLSLLLGIKAIGQILQSIDSLTLP